MVLAVPAAGCRMPPSVRTEVSKGSKVNIHMDVDDWKVFSQILLVLVAVLLICMPVRYYLLTAWSAKRRDIVDGLTEGACIRYFAMFCRGTTAPEEGTAARAFAAMFDKWYGRRNFAASLVLLVTVATIAATAVASSLPISLGWETPPSLKLPHAAIAALAGAYMWVVDDLISRARRLDMEPSDLLWSTLRLLICIPMGYAFSSVTIKELAPFIAFALGAFPITALTDMLRRLSKKGLSLEDTTQETADNIIKLDGTNREIVERLALIDLRTILQIAYCDPVHTTMRSNISFNVITDLMGQALVRIYLRDGCDKIAKMGLRGAVEVRSFIIDLDYMGSDPEMLRHRQFATEMLPDVAAALSLTQPELQFVLRQIADDPYSMFLSEIWA